MPALSQYTIKNFEGRYRTQLVNCLSGFKSANLIGTSDNNGNTNVAIFSSIIHLGSSPALIGFIIRPDSVSRHTLENIKETKQYTINHITSRFWREAHQTSARYRKDESEFKHVGLAPTYIDGHKAPFVSQSRLRYAVELKQIIEIALNETLMIVGEVTELFCEKNAIKSDGYIDLEMLETIAVSGLDSYHTTQRLSRLSYAKPDKPAVSLSTDGLSRKDNNNAGPGQ
jgi:flavin reductase (DIM6/NTAB) family NADH-FMN oxidoreductase RutF